MLVDKEAFKSGFPSESSLSSEFEYSYGTRS